MYQVIFFVHLAGCIIAFINLLVVSLQKSSKNQNILMLASIGAFIGILAYFFELKAVNLPQMMLAVRFGYIGKCYAFFLIIVFAQNYCNIKIPSYIPIGIFIFYSFILLIILTCDYHSFYYVEPRMVFDGLFPHLEFEKGFGYKLNMGVTLCLFAYYAYITISQCLSRRGAERQRLILMVVSGVVPISLLAIHLSGVLPELDPTPIGIVFSCTFLIINVINYGLLDTIQVAQQSVIEHTKEGLLIADLDYNLLYINSVAKNIFKELDLSRNLSEFAAMIFKDSEQKEAIFQYHDKNYEVRVSPLTEDDNIKGYIAWIFDMTFINEYTNEMIGFKKKTELANKAKSSWWGHMTHILRVPTNTIMGSASLALREAESEPVREQLQYIYSSSQNLTHIINELLDISKMESGDFGIIPEKYLTTELFSDLLTFTQRRIHSKNIRLSYDIASDIPKYLKGDRSRIYELLSNLLDNAVKYTKEGMIDFSVTVDKMERDRIVLVFYVNDTGIGMRKEESSKIYDMFGRLDVKRNAGIPGSGLGLTVVKGLVERMGGSIHFDSIYGKGTSFKVCLPQQIADAESIGDFTYGKERIPVSVSE